MLEPRNKSLAFAIALTLSLPFIVYIMHAFVVFIFTCLISICAHIVYAWDYLLTLVFNQESQCSTSTLIKRNLEELVQSPSRGIWLHTCIILGVFSLRIFSLHK